MTIENINLGELPKVHLMHLAIQSLESSINGAQSRVIFKELKTTRELNEMYASIGYCSTVLRKVKDVKRGLEWIARCVLNAEMDNLPKELEIKFSGEVYEAHDAILQEFDFLQAGYELLNLDPEITSMINSMVEKERFGKECAVKYFPGITYFRKNDLGLHVEMTEKEKRQEEFNDYLDTIALTAQLLTWTDDMTEIKKIAENRGNLLKVLKLL
ncbi:MAG: hypothetical protein AAF391_12615 [Bacteroidota bacterium]